MRIKNKHIEVAVYWSSPPLLRAWWQKSAYYKHGFIVRLAWLGFVLRLRAEEEDVRDEKLARSKKAARNRLRTRLVLALIDSAVETDGYDPEPEDYEALADSMIAAAEEPH